MKSIAAFTLLAVLFCAPAYAGEDEPKICGGFAGVPCDAGEFCDRDEGQCGVHDAQGVCVVIGEICPAVYEPVCGCDGKTYGNDCKRIQAKVHLDHKGACGKAESMSAAALVAPAGPTPVSFWEKTKAQHSFQGYQGPQDRQVIFDEVFKPTEPRHLLLGFSIDSLSRTTNQFDVSVYIDVYDTPGPQSGTSVASTTIKANSSSVNLEKLVSFDANNTYRIQWAIVGEEGKNQYQITATRLRASATLLKKVDKLQDLQ